ncbi:tRNA 5-carboxymethoxyuridine methyltransferase [Sinobacterium norvegicum]|uniref:tRNA 5-carboxymethoxyuridine methyltransferase n=1 Tax=Sinobacterium norvegicum TaxID=1641715 RepID=A0ABN8ELN5_9GAMM|nr:class I SAM-dependent methyltransferase [Sinobacterium norvegicum]CAH0993298.1 tRNA 5-carboxymethoxyuridine methyltransferase [Sinobacterium norvegicum]
MTNLHCPLCQSPANSPYFEDQRRRFRQCHDCDLVFVEPRFYLSAVNEKLEYDKHQNSPDDMAYRGFLNRLVEPLQQRLKPASVGLDFGCGPGPTLSQMLQELGHQVQLYDVYYQPNSSLLNQHYDFITATEVVEHLSAPNQVLNQLWSILRPGGILGIMTKQVIDRSHFARWHYKNDLTHIIFFSPYSFTHFFRDKNASIEAINSDTLIITKN